MILTNCSVAEILFKKYPKNTILRIHDGLNINRWDNINEKTKTLEKDLLDNIKILYTNSAEYKISKNIDLQND